VGVAEVPTTDLVIFVSSSAVEEQAAVAAVALTAEEDMVVMEEVVVATEAAAVVETLAEAHGSRIFPKVNKLKCLRLSLLLYSLTHSKVEHVVVAPHKYHAVLYGLKN